VVNFCTSVAARRGGTTCRTGVASCLTRQYFRNGWSCGNNKRRCSAFRMLRDIPEGPTGGHAGVGARLWNPSCPITECSVARQGRCAPSCAFRFLWPRHAWMDECRFFLRTPRRDWCADASWGCWRSRRLRIRAVRNWWPGVSAVFFWFNASCALFYTPIVDSKVLQMISGWPPLCSL
jgi:hypothetical protein